MTIHLRTLGPLMIWIIALEVIGGGIGMITAANINPWYEGLNRAPLSPPNITFGIVWPVLYAMIAIAGWQIWQRRRNLPALCWPLYLGQLLLNWGWSFVFFYAHQPGLGFIWIVCLLAILILLITRLWHLARMTALLLLPYGVWLAFASYLNGYIALFN